jgi:transcriptional regulator with XRE-family HTH domain
METGLILAKIRSKRYELNYSQEYMAIMLQMKQSNYNKIENGKVEMTLTLLSKILNILRLDYNELLLLSNHENLNLLNKSTKGL